MKRHRFAGEVGAACADNSAGGCGLNYSASVHWNDDDHPYATMPDQAGRGCCWVMQNTPGYVGPPVLRCFREPGDPVHNQEPAGDGGGVGAETEVLQVTPPREAPFDDGDLGPVLAERTELLGTLRERENAYQQFGAPWAAAVEREEEEERVGARAAAALVRGDVVPEGPWTVRQWFCPAGGHAGSWEFPGELIAGLNVAGEVYSVDVWWADAERRLVRVTWGDLRGMPEDVMVARVREWE